MFLSLGTIFGLCYMLFGSGNIIAIIYIGTILALPFFILAYYMMNAHFFNNVETSDEELTSETIQELMREVGVNKELSNNKALLALLEKLIKEKKQIPNKWWFELNQIVTEMAENGKTKTEQERNLDYIKNKLEQKESDEMALTIVVNKKTNKPQNY